MRTAKEILMDKATKNNGSFLSGQIKWIEEAMEEYAIEYNLSKKTRQSKYDIDIELVFKSVLAEVKKGHTIQSACKTVNVQRSLFYSLMSKIQKNELRSYRVVGVVNDDLED
jgi:hypothetical protein